MPTAPVGSAGTNPLNTEPTIDPALLAPPDQFGKDAFLKLLVAQLKYQNPMEPMDSSQFMAQTAQFTTVEKLTELTDKLSEGLVNDRLSTATGMIGRDVTYVRADGATVRDRVLAVRFDAMGPQLLLGDGDEIGLGQVQEVSAPIMVNPGGSPTPPPAVIPPADPVEDPPGDPEVSDPADPTDPADPILP